MKNKFIPSLIFSLFLSMLSIHAEIKLASVLGDNMVLQRNTTVKLWGKATAGQKITVKTSWNHAQSQTTTNEKGEWLLSVKTTDAGGPYNIELSGGKDKLTLKNILLGEVWLCSGQSNMEMPILGFPFQPVIGANDALLDADNAEIRLFTVKKAPLATPQDTCSGKWSVSNAESVGKFSAVGYFYAKLLQQKLKVPVGMIFSSVGGTRIEAWMSAETIKAFPEPFKISAAEPREQNRPAHLYNGMIKPIVNYTIKGAIWYQAESNRKNFKDYAALMTAMVANWRSDFGVGDFPFYYVQIAPYAYGDSKAVETAFLREAQMKALPAIPNAHIICTLDLGSEQWIHPADKEPVAKRLALCALSETYGLKGLVYKSPVFKNMVVTDSIATLNFDNAEYGMTNYDKEVQCFEIAGKDSIFYPSRFISMNNDFRKIQVVSSKVKTPVAVRYAFQNFPKTKGLLYNTAGLPLFPFRTDNW